MASLLVRDGGLCTTVQDLGRPGHQALGLPVSGALDPYALRLANALVGNTCDEPALELRWIGPVLEVDADAVRVALVGTSVPIDVLGDHPRQIPAGQSAALQRGEILSLRRIPDTSCCYLAVSSALAVPKVFGSRSTYLRGGVGGLEGRALLPGDRLPLSADAPTPAADLQLTHDLPMRGAGEVRVVLGPQLAHFSEAGIASFLGGRYEVTQATDRMGVRLAGPKIAHAKGYNIPSDGIVTGAIQVPGTGQPIVLLADRQTTGGYPKIASVISSDIPLLGRARPGDAVTFSAVSVEEAETIRRDLEQAILAAIASMRPALSAKADLSDALSRENLISGADWNKDDPAP